MEEKDLAPSFIRPKKWTLLLTGDNRGLVGEFGHKWDRHPAHYERVDVVEAPDSAAEQPAGDLTDERAQFEAWVADKFPLILQDDAGMLLEREGNEYFSCAVQDRWEVWQARAAIAAHLARRPKAEQPADVIAAAEPVAWMCKTGHGTGWRETAPDDDIAWAWTPLYRHPRADGAAPTAAQAAERSEGAWVKLQQAFDAVQQFKRDWQQVPYFADRVNKATRMAILSALSPIVNLDAVGGPLDLSHTPHATIAAAPATSSESVVTPKFHRLLVDYGSARFGDVEPARNRLIAHIESLIAARVAGARKDAISICEKVGRGYDNDWNRSNGTAKIALEVAEECAEAIRALIQSPASGSQEGGAA